MVFSCTFIYQVVKIKKKTKNLSDRNFVSFRVKACQRTHTGHENVAIRVRHISIFRIWDQSVFWYLWLPAMSEPVGKGEPEVGLGAKGDSRKGKLLALKGKLQSKGKDLATFKAFAKGKGKDPTCAAKGEVKTEGSSATLVDESAGLAKPPSTAQVGSTETLPYEPYL